MPSPRPVDDDLLSSIESVDVVNLGLVVVIAETPISLYSVLDECFRFMVGGCNCYLWVFAAFFGQDMLKPLNLCIHLEGLEASFQMVPLHFKFIETLELMFSFRRS